MTKKAEVTWIGPKLEAVGGPTGGPAIVLDSPYGKEGPAVGPSPMELVLVGLASCTMMDVVSILKKKREAFTGLTIKVTGERADEHPRVYTEIHLEYIVTGKGVKPQSVARAIELSETTYCSVSAMLQKTAKITTSYQVIEA